MGSVTVLTQGGWDRIFLDADVQVFRAYILTSREKADMGLTDTKLSFTCILYTPQLRISVGTVRPVRENNAFTHVFPCCS